MHVAFRLAIVAALGAALAYWQLGRQREVAEVFDSGSLSFQATGEVGPRKEDRVVLYGQAMPSTASGDAPFVMQVPSDQTIPPVSDEPDRLAQAPAETPAGQPPQVDESALRYFARQGDQRRLEAEIARLKALYPDWTPPADPLAEPAATDAGLDAIWTLYAQGRLAEARQKIVERQTSEPGWQPPQDLLQRLALAEARERLINASDLKQFDTVVRIGSENQELLTCAETDVLWRIAEAFAGTQRQPRARDVYRYILTSCENPQERLATMQKAINLLDRPMIDELLALEKSDAGGAGEFAPIRDDLARRALARGGEDAGFTASPQDISRVENLAEQGQGADDALLLGWYNLLRKNVDAAERWFRLARERQDSGTASEGLALALMERKAYAEAEAVIYPWRGESEDRRKVYLAAAANLLGLEPRVTLTSEVLSRIVNEAASARDIPTARQLGWYARAFRQHRTAGQWFETALGWDAGDEPSAYGLALTRFALGDTAGLAAIKRQWAGRSQRIEDVGTDRARDESSRSGEAPAATEEKPCDCDETAPAPRPRGEARPARVPKTAAPSRATQCTSHVDPRRLSPEAALQRGWCLMEINRPQEAAAAFEVALLSANEAQRQDAGYGQSLAYLRAGLVENAAIAATKAPQTPARVVELQSSILADRALGAFEQGRYVDALLALDQRRHYSPESIDLMVLRGYAYFNLRRLGEAEKVFDAVARAGSREGVRGLAAVREDGRLP